MKDLFSEPERPMTEKPICIFVATGKPKCEGQSGVIQCDCHGESMRTKALCLSARYKGLTPELSRRAAARSA